jgi:hypothetical protein
MGRLQALQTKSIECSIVRFLKIKCLRIFSPRLSLITANHLEELNLVESRCQGRVFKEIEEKMEPTEEETKKPDPLDEKKINDDVDDEKEPLQKVSKRKLKKMKKEEARQAYWVQKRKVERERKKEKRKEQKEERAKENLQSKEEESTKQVEEDEPALKKKKKERDVPTFGKVVVDCDWENVLADKVQSNSL